MTLREFAAGVQRADVPTGNVFLLTFDDGYASLAGSAYPILADLGFTATTFLITDYIGKMNTWDLQYTWNRLQHLSWPQIEQRASRRGSRPGNRLSIWRRRYPRPAACSERRL